MPGAGTGDWRRLSRRLCGAKHGACPSLQKVSPVSALGGCNVRYMDGHVEFKKYDALGAYPVNKLQADMTAFII